MAKLRAVEPSAAQPAKPKCLIFGKPGVGKTWGAISFPNTYLIDSEGGANLARYTDRLANAGGAYMGPEHGAADLASIATEVQALATAKHNYKTLVIDSVSMPFNAAIVAEQKRLGDKDAFGASKKPAIREIRSLMNWLDRLDMNVVLVAHQKDKWENNVCVGATFDADEKIEYHLHLVLQIAQQGARRVARIGKSRLEGFPTGESFDWCYDEFAARYGRDVMETEAKALTLASADQVAEVVKLLDTVKVAPDFAEKCLSRAKADTWAEMDADKIAAVIESLRQKIAA